MEKFKIQEKKLKRREDLLKHEEKSGLPFLIILVVIFLVAYLFFHYGYFAK